MVRNYLLILTASLLPLLIFSVPAFCFDGPLQVKNQFPLFLQINAPYLESASAENSFSAHLSHSSVFVVRNSADWSVNLDMEITELDLKYKRKIMEHLELGVEAPVLDFGSGFMDSFLSSYHKTFGFPDYGRSSRPANSFLYEVRRKGALVIKGENGEVGLGDIRVTAKQVIWDSDPAVSVRAEVELPTGSASDGHGSGGFDTGLTLLADKKLSEKIESYWNVGVVFPGDLKGIETINLRKFFHAGAGVEFSPWEHLNFIGQILFQSSPFPKTGIGQVDRTSALLSLGGRYSSGSDSAEFSITEDPNTAGAPDVTFNISYKRKIP